MAKLTRHRPSDDIVAELQAIGREREALVARGRVLQAELVASLISEGKANPKLTVDQEQQLRNLAAAMAAGEG